MRQYAKFSGRATRAEYWFYILCLYLMFISLWVLFYIISFVFLLLQPRIDSLILCSILYGYTTAIQILGVIFLAPTLAITVRRLHDASISGKWLLLIIGVNLLSPLLLLNDTVLSAQGRMGQETTALIEHENADTDGPSGPIAPLPDRETRIDDGEEMGAASPRDLETSFNNEDCASNDELKEKRAQGWTASDGDIHLLLNTIGHLLLVFLLVLTLLDSKRGSNKYGPSRKYPLG